jgi:hypothetical protein
VVGDLAALPLATGSVDVIVCFEGIEHVADPYGALDELARVIVPGGSLFVSSPNPAVYPKGNDFHVHEFAPRELFEAVTARSGDGRLVRQYVLLASALIDAFHDAEEPSDIEAAIRTVVPLLADQDRYSMVVTGKAAENLGPATVLLSPSSQLDELEALAITLTSERDGLAAERDLVRQQLESAIAEQHTTSRSLAQAEALVAAGEAALGTCQRRLGDADLRIIDLATESETARAAAGEARAQVGLTATERDRLAADLVRVEQALARADLARPTEAVFPGDGVEEFDRERQSFLAQRDSSILERDGLISERDGLIRERDGLIRERDGLIRERERLHDTVSWRVTRPLRWVRRRAPRR